VSFTSNVGVNQGLGTIELSTQSTWRFREAQAIVIG
jgi:hypothetical protein